MASRFTRVTTESGISAGDRVTGSAGAHSALAAPLIVGRTLEQLFLREELTAALGGHGRLVLLGGEAGIGKTTLARDLASEATARNIQTLAGSCYDLTNTPPYGPWLNLFETYAIDHADPPVPATFAGGRLQTVTDQAALLAEVREFLAALTAARPAVLVLEDLHWADPASLELLRHLAQRLHHWPILLLATYRGDELARRHPFAVQLPTLVREADGLRLDLRRLDEAALGVLVAARYRLPAPDASRLVGYLDRRAEGNPLFTSELLRALREERLLCPERDGWSLAELDRVAVPPFLRQVIEGRVARLGETTRGLLAIAAVIGQDVPLALWAAVAGVDEERLFEVVEQAVEAHLLEAQGDGTEVHFVHALTREALYEGIVPPRRRTWHRRVAEAHLAATHPDPDSVAYHFQQAGDSRAWQWLTAAGDRAQRAYAWLTAAQRLRDAASLLEYIAGHERVRGRLLCRIAYLLRFSDPDGAIDAIDAAAAVAVRIDDAMMAAETRWVRGLLLCYLDRFRSGLAEMSAGFEALAAMPAETAPVPAVLQSWLADALPGGSADNAADSAQIVTQCYAGEPVVWRSVAIGRFLASAGYPRSAADDCYRLSTVLDSMREPASSSRAFVAFNAHALGIAQASLGRPVEAGAAFAQARTEFAALGHHAMVGFTLLNELADVTLTYGAADPTARRRLATEAEAALSRTGGALRSGVSPRLAWLRCLVFDGRWPEADRMLHDLSRPRNAYLRREVTAARAVLARYRGDSERVWEEIRGLLPDGPKTAPGDVIHQEGLFLQRLAVELCLDEGNLPAAREWLATHDRWLAWSESVLGQADGLVAWARYHLATGEIAHARVTAARALALATKPDQPLVRLAAHRLLGEVEAESHNSAAADAHFNAALDLATACDAPFERALALLALARLHAATGRLDMVPPLLDEVRGICGPLAAMPTLADADTLEARLTAKPGSRRHAAGLTPREAEILGLLPRGLSTPEIAAALFISPRTVQSHLSNLYEKLGVGGRAEAIAFAIRHGLA